ncbi:hypothetical protein D3C75_856450 [compost metagenome]
MKVVALAIETENCLIIDVKTTDSVEYATKCFLKGLPEKLGDELISMVLATTEDTDKEFAAEVERALFKAAPGLFVDDYVWVASI